MTSERPSQPELGIIIPCFNEEAVLPVLIGRIRTLISGFSSPARVLFVDDGSVDRTHELIAAACREDDRLACIRLSRNFGHQIAVSAGLRHIRGDCVVVLDADLQDPPEIIPDMLAKWREGYDVVYGVRTNRKENLLLRAAYAAFYRILKRTANVEIPLNAGDFSLMDRKVVDQIITMPEHNPFMRGLRGWVGFRQIGLSYDRPAREAGAPKYDFRRLARLALDGLLSFSSAPLHIAAWAGALFSALGFLLLIWIVMNGLLRGEAPAGWVSLSVLVLFFGGIQLLVLGIIGEYVGRIFEEVKNRPRFIVDRMDGWVTTDSTRKS